MEGIHKACFEGNVEQVNGILSAATPEQNLANLKASFYGSARVPLHYACLSGKIEVVERLLQEEGIDINILDEQNQVSIIFCELYPNYIQPTTITDFSIRNCV